MSINDIENRKAVNAEIERLTALALNFNQLRHVAVGERDALQTRVEYLEIKIREWQRRITSLTTRVMGQATWSELCRLDSEITVTLGNAREISK